MVVGLRELDELGQEVDVLGGVSAVLRCAADGGDLATRRPGADLVRRDVEQGCGLGGGDPACVHQAIAFRVA
jgi:hypothetical protein